VSAVPLTLVNGQPASQLAALDRGVSYGDGVFRTLRVEAGVPRWWDAQIARLTHDAQHLRLVCPSPEIWKSDFDTLQVAESGVLRLTLTRGEGPRGYPFPAFPQPTRIVAFWPGAQTDSLQSITVRLCDLRLARQPVLAGIKHLNRLENVLARAEWHEADIREGILCDAREQVISGVMSNLFIWHDGVLKTPLLDQCGVAGEARAQLLERAQRAGYEVRVCQISLQDLFDAQELMLTNSLALLWRVARLQTREWLTPVISAHLWECLHA